MLLRRYSRDHLNRPWQPWGWVCSFSVEQFFCCNLRQQHRMFTRLTKSRRQRLRLATQSPQPRPRILWDSQVAYINEMIRKGWVDNKVTPSPYATDGEWCRRVYLDIIGRIPTVPELNAFLSDRSADKRLKLVNMLLTDDEKVGVIRGVKEQGYLEEYANNWTSIWSVILVGRPQREENQQRSLTNREGLQQYLRRSFQKNKPYDSMVADLVSATGSNTPGEKDYNGAVNFLLGRWKKTGCRRRPKPPRFSWACKSSAHSATTIRSTNGSKIASGS